MRKLRLIATAIALLSTTGSGFADWDFVRGQHEEKQSQRLAKQEAEDARLKEQRSASTCGFICKAALVVGGLLFLGAVSDKPQRKP
jgi:hypothetical protein